MNAETLYCIDCRVGVAPNNRRCPVCGGALVRELPDPIHATARSGDAELVVLAEVPLSWARDLSSELSKAGIPHAIEAERSGRSSTLHGYSGGASCEVRVPADRRAEAEALQRIVYDRQVPTAANTEPSEPDADAGPQETKRADSSFIRIVRFVAAAGALLVVASRCIGNS